MMEVRDLYWAAGFLEGEGSFGNQRHQVAVKAVQVQREPLERLVRLFGGKIYHCRKNKPGQSDYFQWSTQGSRGAGIAMTLFALMSPRRQGQILKALAHWKSVPYNVNAAVTHCPSGHEYTQSNTLLYEGRRYCRACRASRAGVAARNQRAGCTGQPIQLPDA